MCRYQNNALDEAYILPPLAALPTQCLRYHDYMYVLLIVDVNGGRLHST